MIDLTDEFRDLFALDSPLLDLVAPELVPLRIEMQEIIGRTPSACSPCSRNKQVRDLLVVQVQLQDLAATNAEIGRLLPELIRTGRPNPSETA